MSDEKLDRIIALLELLCRLQGAAPGQVRGAGQPKPEPVPAERGESESAKRELSSVSVVRPGRGARLVPGDQHPHERFSGDRPTSTVKSLESFWRRKE